MTRTPDAATRVHRAAAATAGTVGAGVVAHVLAGGAAPSVDVIALVAATLLPVALLATRARLGRLPTLGLLSAGQYVVHGALVLTAVRPASGPASAPGHCGGPAAHGSTAHGSAEHGSAEHCAALVAHGTEHASGPVAVDDGVMAVLHVAATLAAALLLAQGDRAVAALRGALLAVWRAPVLAPPQPLRALPRRVAAPDVVPPALVCVRRRPRRGPPAARRTAVPLVA